MIWAGLLIYALISTIICLWVFSKMIDITYGEIVGLLLFGWVVAPLYCACWCLDNMDKTAIKRRK